MNFAKPEQIDLLSKLQILGLFKDVSHSTFTEDQAKEIFGMLPALEWQSVDAADQDGNPCYQDFIGVSEYDIKKQIEHWSMDNNYNIEHISSPDFGGGEVWLDYFQQPVKQINLSLLENMFNLWGLPVSIKRLPLAFNDVDQAEIENFYKLRPSTEQYAKLRYYAETGKMPVLPKDKYMSLNQGEAEKLLEKFKDAPETRRLPEKIIKTTFFPEYKEVNLLSKPKANYLQRLIIRDLMQSNSICNNENKAELESKLDFITFEQAEKIINTHKDRPAGGFLLQSLNGFIRSGKLINLDHLRNKQITITQAECVFTTHASRDRLKQDIIKDLIDNNYISGKKDELYQKVPFMPQNLMDELISKYGAARCGNRLRNYLQDMADAGTIGALDDNALCSVTVRRGLEWVAMCQETEMFKKKITPGQLIALKKLRNYIDQKTDLQSLSQYQASSMIQIAIKRMKEHQQNRENVPVVPNHMNFHTNGIER